MNKQPQFNHYVVLYRPAGSKTWTPWPCEDRDAGNFFATALKALTYIQEHPWTAIDMGAEGETRPVPVEFKVAGVAALDQFPTPNEPASPPSNP